MVVIGETRRGKTTLINALVDNPDLDPLTALDLPATFVEVIPRAGDQAPARPLVVVPGQTPGGDRISLAELGELAADEDAHLPLGIRVLVAGELGPVIEALQAADLAERLARAGQ